MQENETAPEGASVAAEGGAAEGSTAEGSTAEGGEQPAAQAPTEEITYHAVEKDGQVTAIWEMQGRKHLRTIDPRSRQGQDILRLYTADHQDEAAAGGASET
ncbi:MAG TPA: hypothetical protein VGC87_13100 [Pyrinomonadaceae bacterium]|jgi:hypothetical protein